MIPTDKLIEMYGPRMTWSEPVSERSEIPQRIEWMREQVVIDGHRIVNRSQEPTLRPFKAGWRIEWDVELEA